MKEIVKFEVEVEIEYDHKKYRSKAIKLAKLCVVSATEWDYCYKATPLKAKEIK
jgi:hypothetical protein